MISTSGFDERRMAAHADAAHDDADGYDHR
jgi:hypothetical protein